MDERQRLTGEVVSVNVGRPRLIEWRGQQVRTAIEKSPVHGRVVARRLDLDGDEQADLAGHGGENRAMLVYQLDSYRFWQQMFGDAPYAMGWFGENLTVEGLPDCEVCIGDRFRVGEALVEVTQPRVTCYRLGIRTGRPEMPSLFVKHGRPGFYVRVLEEGTIGAEDRIELVGSAPTQMSVASIDKLLYLGEHPAEDLKSALSIGALSEGWKGSFRQLLQAHERGSVVGNPGLTGKAESESWQGFRPLTVVSQAVEALEVRSICLETEDGSRLPPFRPGQYVVLKTNTPDGRPLLRSYSLSGDPEGGHYRISIKRESGGLASSLLQERLLPGIAIEVSAPRGTFVLNEASTAPVVLLSAGIGITPVLSMLYALSKTTRQVYWIHGARDGSHLAFRTEVNSLLAALPHAKRLIAHSQPCSGDILGETYDLHGRLNMEAVADLRIDSDAEYYLCGPSQFLTDFTTGLQHSGVVQHRIHLETFGQPAPPRTEPVSTGNDAAFNVALTRSGRVVSWTEGCGSLLELAEAEQVPVLWSCRVGVCHRCESGLLEGKIAYTPEPLDPPPTPPVAMTTPNFFKPSFTPIGGSGCFRNSPGIDRRSSPVCS